MFEFDQSGLIAKISLELILAVNKAYPDVTPETIAMAFMTASIEKAVLAKIEPMDYMIALSMSWSYVAGVHKAVDAITTTPPAAEASPALEQKPEPPIVITKQPKGVH